MSQDTSKKLDYDYAVILKRIDDYREACQYMMKVVGDRKKAAEFLSVAERLKLMEENIQKGKRVDTLNIEPDVTPSLILGYSEEDRQKKFNELVKVYDERLEVNKSKAYKLVEVSKQVKKME